MHANVAKQNYPNSSFAALRPYFTYLTANKEGMMPARLVLIATLCGLASTADGKAVY